MIKREIKKLLGNYRHFLELSELNKNTIIKYISDVNKFLLYIQFSNEVNKDMLISYKNHLLYNYKISSVNSYIISLNKFFNWLKRDDLKLKTERIQKKTSLENIISFEQYTKLLQYLENKGKEKDYLLIKTIAMTGIRIGELRYITYESIIKGHVSIMHKKRTRTIYLPEYLCDILQIYCNNHDINSGIIFYGRNKNKPLDTSGIWRKMKRTAHNANIPEEVVYPHSFRHLFAKTYMDKIGNISELADILGHSSIEITRIYTLTSSIEKRRALDSLGL